MSHLLVAGRRLECVRERVPEIEHGALAAVVWVAEADGCLERRAATDEVRGRQLPERLAGKEARFHHLRHPLAALTLGKRFEQCRIDDNAARPVKGADEALPRGQ